MVHALSRCKHLTVYWRHTYFFSLRTNMAYNLAYQLRSTKTNTSLHDDSTSLVERANSLLSESQSLWVLFNPLDVTSATKAETDILSLTADSQRTEDDDDEEDDEDVLQQHIAPRDGRHLELEDNDSLVDKLKHDNSEADGTPGRIQRLFFNYAGTDSSLRKRINDWKSLQTVTETSTLDEDNVASWDLDENIVAELLQQSQAVTPKLLSPQTSQLLGSRDHKYYGDEVFEDYSMREINLVKKVTQELKSSLNRKAESKGRNLNDLALKYLVRQQERHHKVHRTPYQESSETNPSNVHRQKRYSTILNEHYNMIEKNDFLSTIVQNQLRGAQSAHLHNYGGRHNDAFSSTGSSSMVMCGAGAGLGSSSSWADT